MLRRPAHHAHHRSAPWAWAGWGAALGLMLTVLLQAPAQWLAVAVAAASQDRVQLMQAAGSVWTGSARLEFTGGEGSRDHMALPGRIQWRLRPTWTGLHLALQADCCTTQPMQLAISPRWGGGQLTMEDSAPSHWPSGLLVGLGAPWNTLQLQGQLRLSTQNLSMLWSEGRPHLNGQAELQVLDASSRLSTLKPLGSYRLLLQGGDSPTLELSTLDGPLQISGSGRWVGSRLRFNGEVRAVPEREEVLDNLLNIVGRRKGPRSLISLG